MVRVVRDDRRRVNVARFREALTANFGDPPNFRRAAKKLRVPRSTLHRLWKGRRVASAENYTLLCKGFGIDQEWLARHDWITPYPHKGGKIGLVFQGTPREGDRITYPGLKGTYWLARIGECLDKLGPASSDTQLKRRLRAEARQRGVRRRPANAPRMFPRRRFPSAVVNLIGAAVDTVAHEWNRRLGRLPPRERSKVLDAWCYAWAVTLEAACKLPPSAGTRS